MSKISKVAHAAIRELRQKGIEPTLDEIVTLHDLGTDVERHGRVAALETIGSPAKAGNVYLWPLTIGASIWYMSGPCIWFKRDERMNLYAIAYTLCHSRKQDAFITLVSETATRQAINNWLSSVYATYEELADAISILFSRSTEEQAPDRSDPDWGEFIGFLAKEYGGSPDVWCWDEPLNLCLHLASVACKQYKAEGTAPDPNDPHIKATWRLRCEINKITEKWKAEHENTDG